MFKNFSNKFITNIFTYGLGSLMLGIPFVIYWLLKDYLWLGVASVGLFLFVVAYETHEKILEESEKELKTEINKITTTLNVVEEKEKMWKTLLKEKSSGFPSLFKGISFYEELIDDKLSNYLRHKPHPAISSAEIVKAEAKRRREAEFLLRTKQSLIEYYEDIAPFLLDFKEETFFEDEEAIKEYTEEERADPVTNFLLKAEYKKLSPREKNQLALERFWSRQKSKWLLGRIYERYVGYLYERENYNVEYTGIFHGFEDLGRDLVCTKGNDVIIIQCKNWSQFKTIYEKHIFQFFGTVFQYKDQNPKKHVRAIFYTTTELSPLAKRFAEELKIELKEKFKMPSSYPCIKCNVSLANGVKIYHLPFDQQYDKTKIEVDRGEFYCETVSEAESKGFRRAFKWRGKEN